MLLRRGAATGATVGPTVRGRAARRLLADAGASGLLGGSLAAAAVTVRPPGAPNYGLSVRRYRQYQRRVYRALVVVHPDRLAIRPDARGHREGWPDVEVPVSAVSEAAFDRAPLGARVYLGLRGGEVLHFGVGGDSERLAAALRAAGVQVRSA